MSSDTGARVTDSDVFALAAEWTGDKLSARAEIATTKSSTVNPNLSSTLNFINPNGNLVARVNFDDGAGNSGRVNVGLVGPIQTLEDAIASRGELDGWFRL